MDMRRDESTECPHCHLINPATTVACDCGHVFEGSAAETKSGRRAKACRYKPIRTLPWFREYFERCRAGAVVAVVNAMWTLGIGCLLVIASIFGGPESDSGFLWVWPDAWVTNALGAAIGAWFVGAAIAGRASHSASTLITWFVRCLVFGTGAGAYLAGAITLTSVYPKFAAMEGQLGIGAPGGALRSFELCSVIGLIGGWVAYGMFGPRWPELLPAAPLHETAHRLDPNGTCMYCGISKSRIDEFGMDCPEAWKHSHRRKRGRR